VSNPKTGSDYDILNFGSYRYSIANAAGTQKTNTFVFAGTIYVGWGTDDYSNVGAIGRPWGSSCTTQVASGTPTCDANGLPKASTPGTPNTNGAGGALITRGQPVALSVLFDPTVARVGSSNHFTVTSTPIPASFTGSGVVAYAGRVSLQKDATTSYAIPVKNVVSYFSLGSGPVVPRRDVVSTAKCEVCHDKFIKNHGHGGSRTTTEVCVICHNGNNPLNGTVVAGGVVTAYAESAHFKRFIHMAHEELAQNNKNPTTLLGQGINFPAQEKNTAVYGKLNNCNMCHVNNSYQLDKGVMGTSVTYAVDLSKNSTSASITDTDPSDNLVISPKASACSSCHTSDAAKTHMIGVGGASFGTVTQADLANGRVNETCNNCHGPGNLLPMETAHGLK
jgi:OmcA/MtrC family decaheme c-type cytochrome